MKNTIRVLSLILALVLCLSLAACSSADDKAFEEADALLAAGDYDGAIAAFSAIGRYQEISAKIAEAEKLRDDANMGFLFGNWMDITCGYTFTFNEDGTGVITYPDNVNSPPTSISYTYSDGIVKLTSPYSWNMPVSEIDGVIHIISESPSYHLVPEANYPELGPYEVEISMDNWQEYFEIRRADDVSFNSFGEPENRAACHGLFLKDEYAQMLAQDYGESVDISVEVQYDEAWFQPSGDFIRGNYELIPSDPPRWHSAPETGLTDVASVYDDRAWGEEEENKDDFTGTVAAHITYGYLTTYDDIPYIKGAVNLEVIRISGTLTFKR